MKNHLLSLLVLFVFCWIAPAANAADMGPGNKIQKSGGRIIGFGTQPLALPIAMISELMKRDLLLRKYLAGDKQEIRENGFFNGDDMLDPLQKGEIEVAMLGDMPTIAAASRHDILLVGLLKQSFSSVVARKFMQISDLKGKRIAFVSGSTAHYTLLEGLASVGLTEKDVSLVEMKITEMPDALEKGTIDAFSAWEPAPTLSLSRNFRNAAVYRGFNATYLIINRHFAAQRPEDARQLVASCVRAINWLRQPGRKNVEIAAKWSLESMKSFSAKTSPLTVDQVVAITRRELLEMESLPLIPKTELTGYSPLSREFEFLKKIGKLPANAQWENVRDSISRDLMNEVLSHSVLYKLHEFDYAAYKVAEK